MPRRMEKSMYCFVKDDKINCHINLSHSEKSETIIKILDSLEFESTCNVVEHKTQYRTSTTIRCPPFRSVGQYQKEKPVDGNWKCAPSDKMMQCTSNGITYIAERLESKDSKGLKNSPFSGTYFIKVGKYNADYKI